MKEFFDLNDLRDWDEIMREISPAIRLGVLGDPVAHSQSPAMQNAALAETGLAMQYARFQIAPNELEAALRRMCELGFVGCNLTVPHKIAALALVDEVEERARKIGAINTIVFRGGRSLGWNTDAPGFARAIREVFSVDLRDMRVLLLGAGGGAGRALAYECAWENCERLVLVNRTLEKAQALAARTGELLQRPARSRTGGAARGGPMGGDRASSAAWPDRSGDSRHDARPKTIRSVAAPGLAPCTAPDDLRSDLQGDAHAAARGRGRRGRARRQWPDDAVAPGRAGF